MNEKISDFNEITAPAKAMEYAGALAGENVKLSQDNLEKGLYKFGTGVPSITPDFVGQTYVKTVGPVYYFSKGTASSADWEEIALPGPQDPLESYSTGGVTRSDWNATFFGSVEINYTVKVGTFTIGEAFTSGSHGGFIAQDTGTKLILSDVFYSGPLGNSGLFVIGNVITGTDSGATAICTSDTENVATLVTHNLIAGATQLKITLTIKYSGDTFNVPVGIQGTGNSGFTYYAIGSNTIKIVVGDVGWKYMLDTYTLSANITTQEAEFEITVTKLF